MKIVKVDQREYSVSDDCTQFTIFRVDHETRVGDMVDSMIYDVNDQGFVTDFRQFEYRVTENDLAGNGGIRFMEITSAHYVPKKEPSKTKPLPEMQEEKTIKVDRSKDTTRKVKASKK